MGQLVKCVGRADMASGRCRTCGQTCDSSGSCYSYLEVRDPPVGARAELWRGMYEQSQADLARLQARVATLEDVLRSVHDWRGLCDSGSLETWERIAELFYRDTHMLRPGKDQAAALGGYPTDEERNKAWSEWVTRKNDELDAAIRAALPDAGGAR